MMYLPGYFINLVVCNQLPFKGFDDLIEGSLARFRSMNIRKLSWLAHDGGSSTEIYKVMLAHDLPIRLSLSDPLMDTA